MRDIPESSNPFQANKRPTRQRCCFGYHMLPPNCGLQHQYHQCQGLVAMAQPKLRVPLPRSSVVAGEAEWTDVQVDFVQVDLPLHLHGKSWQPKKICDTRHYASSLALCQERCNCADAGGVVCLQENESNIIKQSRRNCLRKSLMFARNKQ